MDRRGVASSRKRPRIAASPPPDAAEAAPPTDENHTEPASDVRRSRSALKREKKRGASARREAQGTASESIGTHGGAQHASTHRKTNVSGGELITGDLEAGRQMYNAAPSQSRGKAQKRAKSGLRPFGQGTVTPTTPEADQPLRSDHLATNATSGRVEIPNISLGSALGGARAAMRAKDMEAAAAAVAAADKAREDTLTRAREEEQEASRRAQQQALLEAQTSLEKLRTDVERLQEESRAKVRKTRERACTRDLVTDDAHVRYRLPPGSSDAKPELSSLIPLRPSLMRNLPRIGLPTTRTQPLWSHFLCSLPDRLVPAARPRRDRSYSGLLHRKPEKGRRSCRHEAQKEDLSSLSR